MSEPRCSCGVSWNADYDSPEPDVDPDCPKHGDVVETLLDEPVDAQDQVEPPF